MRKIAQGRDRRRQRQLEAAERQVNFTKNVLASRLISPATRERLQDRLAIQEQRLKDMQHGNYPT